MGPVAQERPVALPPLARALSYHWEHFTADVRRAAPLARFERWYSDQTKHVFVRIFFDPQDWDDVKRAEHRAWDDLMCRGFIIAFVGHGARGRGEVLIRIGGYYGTEEALQERAPAPAPASSATDPAAAPNAERAA